MNNKQFFVPPEALSSYQEMPKINLHSHLEGSIRPETFLELAHDQKLDLPFASDEIHQYIQITGQEQSLTDYLDKIRVNYQILKNSEALRRTAFEAAEDAHRDGVVYLELRAGPVTHITKSLSVSKCIESILTGLKQAEAQYGIICRLIISGLRDHNPETNLELAELALHYINDGVVGFDLAGDEIGFPALLHKDAFVRLQDTNLGLTVHAGEAGNYQNVDYAINILNAKRIGHGVRSIESHETLSLLREKNILLEICPTSNVHTGTFPDIYKHPVRDLYDFGIQISIGDDDPITSRTNLSKELTLLHEIFGFNFEELINIQLMGLENSFLRESDIKLKLQEKIMSFNP